MSFNYGKEKKIFIEDWKTKRAEYEAAGMSEEAISEMYAFDLEWFRSGRRFATHTQTLTMEFSDYGPEEVPNSLVEKFEGFSVEFSQTHLTDLTGWIDDVEDEVLLECLKLLSDEQQEIATFYFQHGFTQGEIAKMYHCDQATICRKLLKIENLLKMCIKNGFPLPTE